MPTLARFGKVKLQMSPPETLQERAPRQPGRAALRCAARPVMAGLDPAIQPRRPNPPGWPAQGRP
jgi:hypothetical protein